MTSNDTRTSAQKRQDTINERKAEAERLGMSYTDYVKSLKAQKRKPGKKKTGTAPAAQEDSVEETRRAIRGAKGQTGSTVAEQATAALTHIHDDDSMSWKDDAHKGEAILKLMSGDEEVQLAGLRMYETSLRYTEAARIKDELIEGGIDDDVAETIRFKMCNPHAEVREWVSEVVLPKIKSGEWSTVPKKDFATTNPTSGPSQSPAEIREELNKALEQMRNHPFRSAIEALIVEQAEAKGGKHAKWVIQVLNDESDPLHRAKSIRAAKGVFLSIGHQIAEPLVPLDIAQLEADRKVILGDVNASKLTGWVAEKISDPGDLKHMQNRASLRKALAIAHGVLGRYIETAAVVAKVLETIDPWFSYGWDAELDAIEQRDAERTANQANPYVPWKVELIDEALAAYKADLEDGGSALLALCGNTNKLHGLLKAIDVFRRVVTETGQTLFESHELQMQFEALLGGDKAKASNSKPSDGAPTRRSSTSEEKRAKAERNRKNREARAEADKAKAAANPERKRGYEQVGGRKKKS